MTPKQLKSAKEVLEPLFMIYRLQGHDVEWHEEDENEEKYFPDEFLGITVKKGDARYTLWIDIDVDEKGLYSCDTDFDITWGKLKRLPNQIDFHVSKFLKTI